MTACEWAGVDSTPDDTCCASMIWQSSGAPVNVQWGWVQVTELRDSQNPMVFFLVSK